MADIESNPTKTVQYEMVPTNHGNELNTGEIYPKNTGADQIAGSRHIDMEKSSRKGIILEWSDINYSTPLPDKSGTKQILHSLEGNAYPREMLGIMGTSGAGKSTLLDVLAGRLESKFLTGVITTNGSRVDKKSFRRESGYVMQSDALFPFLTVRETFRFAAYFRVHDKTRIEKDEIADNTIKLLRLESCADTTVGDENTRGISGGEKRRVSIGVDIVHQPKVIFLDEPTSGLDSTTAYSIVDALKQIAITQNSTIVMTIHQPSARLFNILDKVMFLSAGKITFSGESSALLGHIENMYTKLGLGRPPVANPPELFLELSDQLNEEGKLQYLTEKFESAKQKNPELSKSISTHVINSDDNQEHAYANSLLGDVSILSERALTNTVRTKELFFARFGSAVFFGIQLGTLFLNTPQTDVGIQHRTSYLVFTLAFFYYTSLEALPIFLAERETFQREYSSGAYRALAYTIASMAVTIPFMFVIAAVYSCVTWWLVGMPNIGSIFWFNILTVFVVLIAGNTFATMVSTLAPNPMAGQTAGSALFSVMFLYSGFFIKRSDIPPWWIYLHYMSLFKYAYDSLLVNAFQNTVTTDDMDNEQVLSYYSVNNTNRWTGVGVLVGWIIFYRLIFYYRLLTAFNGSRK